MKIEDAKAPRAKEFKYLGLTVQESGSCEREVKKKVQARWNGWRKVSRVICDRMLSARVKEKVYISVVRPAMVHGLGTMAVTKKQVEEMEVREIRRLRFSLGVMKKDKIRNEYIRGTVKVELFEMKMKEGKLRRYGNVMRRDQEYSYIERMVIEIELPGKKEKRKAEEKISGCSKGGYERNWCKRDGHWKQDAVEEHLTLWQPPDQEKS